MACIYEDRYGKDRYVLLMSEFESAALTVHDVIYTSPDLLHWTKKEGVRYRKFGILPAPRETRKELPV